MESLKYSETFYSAQGEGKYTGIPSLWMRFFLCNLQCDGFGQTDPTDPSTYELPYEKLDLTDITDVMQLPVFEKGCDSSYTWSKRYRHLITERSVEQAVDELEALLPHGKFCHPKTKQWTHMVFTGGEPLLKASQQSMIAVLEEFRKRNNYPQDVTIETNGTQELGEDLDIYIDMSNFEEDLEWYWSVSPKLWSTAGEKPNKAIKPYVVGKYAEASPHGQLKYVVNGSEESWREVEEHTKAFRSAGCNFPVWIMGIGGTLEGLKMTEAEIADQAIQLGYNYTTRAHVHIYGNAIGK